MAFGFAGAAAGANDELQQMLTQRRAAFLQQQQMQQQQAQQQASGQRADRELQLQEQQGADLHAQRTAQQQDTERNQTELAKIAQDPTLPPQVRQLVNLRMRGVTGINSVSDLMPKEPTPPKLTTVTTLGPKGGPLEKGFTDQEMAAGVPKYVPPPAPDNSVVKVEHKDTATGRTVIEYLPKSEVRGKTYEKGVNATTENRLASAEAVNQTGDDIINKVSDPQYAQHLGVAMGRYNSLREFVGNPPPEFSELAGMIESYSLANMGVHGMRSAQGAEMIRKLLDQPQTPQSVVGAIHGLNQFSSHFMENEGRPQKTPAAATAGGPKVGDTKTFPNGRTGTFDGQGWVPNGR